MQQQNAFKRASMMMQAIAAAVGAGWSHFDACGMVGNYVSRGHGRGGHSGKKWGPWPSGIYTGVTNGKRECERRVRQIAAGRIAVSA